MISGPIRQDGPIDFHYKNVLKNYGNNIIIGIISLQFYGQNNPYLCVLFLQQLN